MIRTTGRSLRSPIRRPWAALAGLSALLATALVAPTGAHAASEENPCPWVGSTASADQRAHDVLAQMTLAEKVSTLGLTASPDGYQNYFPAIPRLCVPRLILQDGPAGVANGFTGVTQLPAPLGLAASWDRSLATGYGTVQGRESWDKGIEVAQGPNLNIARVPQGGRVFEAYGEDPYLAGQMGVANINGIQSQGVMADVKHFFANNQETDRESINEHIDERTQHEIYLPQFEAAVKQGDVASMMCAYNQVNGAFSCHNHQLLTELLKDDWGFKGFVRSDFGATHSTPDAYNAGMDLAKPGQADLRSAVENGLIPMSRIDDGIVRVLGTMFEYGLFERQPTGTKDTVVTTPEHAAIAKDVAAQGTVLLKNSDGILPLDSKKTTSVAVLGDNAADAPYTGGGGSSAVEAPYVVSPLQGITDRAGDGVTVRHPAGQPDGAGGLPIVPSQYLTPPSGTGHGLAASYYNNVNLTGDPVLTRVDPNVDFNWDGSPGPGVNANNFSARWTGALTPPTSTNYTFSLVTQDGSRLYIDDKLVIDNWNDGRTCCHKLPDGKWGTVALEAGKSYSIKVEYFHSTGKRPAHLGWSDVSRMRQDAAEAARQSDVAVVVANDRRTESMDRPNLQLPYEQDKLIEAVAKANPHTVVVLNTGGPVLMPWLDKVAGVVEAWYSGQEDGNALASVLFGDVNPSGKLPMTFPRDEAQTPVSSPERWPGVGGQAYYSEGLQVGYRWYDANDVEPLFPFGHGLSYTSFQVDHLVVAPKQLGHNGKLKVQADVTNTGARAGAEVVQLYVGLPKSAGEPPRQLKGFQKVSLQPGETRRLTFELAPRDVGYWDAREHDWVTPIGTYQVMVGTSSRDIAASDSFRVKQDDGPRYVTLEAADTLRPGTTGTVTTSFTNIGKNQVQQVRLTLDAPNGWQAQPKSGTLFNTVAPGQTVSTRWQVAIPADATAGDPQLVAKAAYQAPGGPRTSRDSMTVHVRVLYRSLAAAYNNIGITDDNDPEGGTLNSSGDSFSAQALAALGLGRGAKFTHDGIDFVWPDVPAGTSDHVALGGQEIVLEGRGQALGVVGTSVNATFSDKGEIRYSDGTIQPFDLTLTYWRQQNTEGGNDLIAHSTYTHRRGRGQLNSQGNLFYASIPLDPNKTVAEVRLPHESQMHIFTWGIKP
ncbi:glycoside hydrolase family 3 C-terminal domain-containing protein [Streptomyces sp. NPDC058424]|uniref:glycoside hydrolase family 3 C-terminal domain-containing protein n=1 Tax=Streptomyces sp. NPDC058424 TaxID=3346491 RepID=UPI0036650802